MAAPKIKRMIIAVKIFGAADGFLPKAWMLVKPAAPRMIAGPRIAIIKIRTSDISRLIFFRSPQWRKQCYQKGLLRCLF